MQPLSPTVRSLWIICSMGVLSGLVLLDETVLGVALPSIRASLDLSEGQTHWIVNAYFLTLTCLAALGGKCVDLFGLRSVLVVAMGVFSIASLLAGFADSAPSLIAMRALQGAGAALLFALSQAGANMAFPTEKRGLGIGIYAAIATVFLAVGPLVGGLVTHFVSWQWIFWLNIPIVMIIGTIAFTVWRAPHETPPRQGIDGIGALLMLIGLTGLVFALMQGPSLGWLSYTIIGCATIGVLSLFVFDRYEMRQEQPLIDVLLFRNRAFSSACMVFMICQYAMIVMAVFLPIFLQNQMQYSAAEAGLAVVLAVVAFPIVSVPVGRFSDKIGSRRILIAGSGGAAIATLLLALLMPFKAYWLFAAPLLLWGISMVGIAGPSRRVAVNAAPEKEQGQLSGTVVTIRLLGSTIGVAASSAIITAGYGIPVVFWVCGALLIVALGLSIFVLTDDNDASADSSEPS